MSTPETAQPESMTICPDSGGSTQCAGCYLMESQGLASPCLSSRPAGGAMSTPETDQWNPRWNYHLGGEPRSVCACPDGPYEGARPATWPRWCERCGGLVDGAQVDAMHAELRRRHQVSRPEGER